MISTIISNDVTILPYPLPANDVTIPVEKSPSRASTSASMRRLRTETTTYDVFAPVRSVESAINQLGIEIEAAIREERHQDALQLIENFEKSWNETMRDKLIAFAEGQFPIPTPHLRPAIELLSSAAIQEAKAYFMALLSNRDALPVSEDGFVKLRQALEEGVQFLKGLPFAAPNVTDQAIQDAENSIRAIHDLFSGFLKLAFQMNEEAANDLRAFCLNKQPHGIFYWESTLQVPFMMKVLEKKLGAKILPDLETVDETDPNSLFLASRYEEALALLDSPCHCYRDFDNVRALSLAMLGKYKKAIAAFPDSDYDKSDFEALVYILKGDLEKAKQNILAGDIDGQLLLLLAIQGLRN